MAVLIRIAGVLLEVAGMASTALCLAFSVMAKHNGDYDDAWALGVGACFGWALARFGWCVQWNLDQLQAERKARESADR